MQIVWGKFTFKGLFVYDRHFTGVDIATLAAFLETRRDATLKGATVEFQK